MKHTKIYHFWCAENQKDFPAKEVMLAICAIFLVMLSSGCAQQYEETKEPTTTPYSADESQQQPEQISEPEIKPEIPIKAITFEVTIPKNTPKGDTVWVYIKQIPHKMEKIDDYTFSVTLREAQLFGEGYILGLNEKLRYRYSRNGYEFRTAEYLTPIPEEPDRDTSNYFWTAHGREIDYEPGKIQKDTIERWRWFPKEGMITKTTNLEPSGKFLPRVNNLEFRSGQTIEDLYVPAFHDFFNSTAQHLKEQGYTWIEIDPPWQWIEVNGYPKVVNDLKSNPNYPDDETFLEELGAYKQLGLKLLIAPQLCCTPLDIENKPREWWERYFDETEKFLLHFAELSQQGGADAFMYAVPSSQMESSPMYPTGVQERWERIWENIHFVFKGEVGQMVWIGGADAPPQSIPSPEFITWYNQLDFILVATEYPVSTKNNPTDEELYQGASTILDGIKPLHDKLKKPLLVRNGYFNVRYSWKGQAFYSIGSIPWISDSEAALEESKYEFDTNDHARTVHAYFRAIAERPWVIGYFHFGYTHWEDPLSPWMSIRGKPAEDVWRKWNRAIYNE